MKRRQFLTTAAPAAAALFTPTLLRAQQSGPAIEGSLPVPSLVDVAEDGVDLRAQAGTTAFLAGRETPTVGYSQSYLGPTLRMRRGRTARVNIANSLETGITTHWHGLHIPGREDGGPQSVIAPGSAFGYGLEIDQPAGTFWYHSHMHGETGRQVYAGLAGLVLIDDPDAPDPGLPAEYGVDDIPLVVQDKQFGRGGRLVYGSGGMAMMNGFRGDQAMVNGAIRPQADVPAGRVRLRILNGSNARIYHFRFEDGRVFHKVASDAGLLPAPVPMDQLMLAPAERAEIVVDFSDGAAVRLVSDPDRNAMMQGMGMGGRSSGFEVMRFRPDQARPGKAGPLPATLAGAQRPDFGEPVRRRSFRLNMMRGGMGGMMGGMMGGSGDALGINGQAFDMERIDQQVPLGETEIWEVSADMMSHPFHVHGTSFQVLSENGRPVDYGRMGMKDVVLVAAPTEILIRFDRPASRATPFMYHCHILEHEDNGMMGQFTVS